MSELKRLLRFPDYAVDSEGNVWRVVAQTNGRRWKNKPVPYKLAAATSDPGYPNVVLVRDGNLHTVRVHRLVCEAFHGPAPRWKNYVAHIDGVKTNNKPDNLRWCTQKENLADRDRHGTKPYGEKLPISKLNDAVVKSIRLIPHYRGIYAALARKYRVSRGVIREAYCGITWRHLPIEEGVSFLA